MAEDGNKKLLEALQRRFADIDLAPSMFRGQLTIHVPPQRLLEMMKALRDEVPFEFDQLTDVIGIDYLHLSGAKQRFAIVYPLVSTRRNHRLLVKVLLDEQRMELPSMTQLWYGAEWPEREAAEMFGFVFTNHPDPRPLLLPPQLVGKFPLRKDYPLRGRGERENLTVIRRDSA